jgi:PEP-CTERM motif
MQFLERMASAAALGAAMVVGAGLSAPPAQAAFVVTLEQNAAFVVTLEQEGPNVVATGSGTIDLADLSFINTVGESRSLISSGRPEISIGFANSVDFYAPEGTFTGPPNFGSGGQSFASSSTGVAVALELGFILLPSGYVSGSPLSGSSTWDNATFASLGVTPGVYTWTWGTAPFADSFTLIAGAAPAAPEASTWAMMLIGFLGLAGVGFRNKRRQTAAAMGPTYVRKARV